MFAPIHPLLTWLLVLCQSDDHPRVLLRSRISSSNAPLLVTMTNDGAFIASALIPPIASSQVIFSSDVPSTCVTSHPQDSSTRPHANLVRIRCRLVPRPPPPSLRSWTQLLVVSLIGHPAITHRVALLHPLASIASNEVCCLFRTLTRFEAAALGAGGGCLWEFDFEACALRPLVCDGVSSVCTVNGGGFVVESDRGVHFLDPKGCAEASFVPCGEGHALLLADEAVLLAESLEHELDVCSDRPLLSYREETQSSLRHAQSLRSCPLSGSRRELAPPSKPACHRPSV